jgi:hypothetical protein
MADRDDFIFAGLGSGLSITLTLLTLANSALALPPPGHDDNSFQIGAIS